MMHIMKLMIPKVLGHDNKKVSKIQVMTLGHYWSLHDKPNEILNYILGIASVYSGL